MTTFGLYLRDLSHHRTQSHGIVNYALGLTRALPAVLAPDEHLVVYGNAEVAAELAPLPSSVRLLADDGPVQGAGRLYHDHVASVRDARRDGVRVLHFPKGFVPLVNPTAVRLVATIHDDIPVRYWQGTWGAEHRSARTAYFSWAIGHAARRADTVLTVSEFTRTQLRRRWPRTDPQVTHQGVVLPRMAYVPVVNREPYALHFGSVLPHKRSIDGLERMLRWLDGHPAAGVRQIHVTGEVRHSAGVTDDSRVVRVDGPLANSTVAELMSRARLVVFPSAYEGFGLPPLEATILGTPVVHARIPAVGEVLGDGAPGGYDPDDPGSFDAAVDSVLNLGDDALRAAAAAAATRFDWGQVAERTLRAYRDTATG